MPYYSGSEDNVELDLRIHRGRHSPAPIRYVDPRARERERIERERLERERERERRERADRIAYYAAAVTSGARLLPNRSVGAAIHRSRSDTRQSMPPPGLPPVIINNHVNDKYYEEEVLIEEDPRYHYPQLIAAPIRHVHRSYSRRRNSRGHGSSHSRSSSGSFSSHHSKSAKEAAEKEAAEKAAKKQAEVDQALKELDTFKKKEKEAEEEKEKKKQEEFARLQKKEKDERDAKEKKAAEEKAIKEWQEMEKEKKEKEKKAKEEDDKRYKERMEEDMRKAGMSEQQIAAVLKKEIGNQVMVKERDTYTRMARRHISLETLRTHHIDFEFDVDPEFVIIKRWVPEYEQDYLFNHTRQIRGEPGHHQQLMPPPPHPGTIVEDPPRHHHHHEPKEYDHFKFVGKKRRHSPSQLLTFFAGGRTK